jgi:carbon monoxide dehydrogenase subunit G
VAAIALRSSAIIGRSVQDVWAFLSNPENEPRWHTDILEVKSASDPDSGVGTRWVLGATYLVIVQFMGRNEYEIEITGLEENRRVEITTQTGPMKPTATYLLEPADGGTRFLRHVDVPLSGPMRVLGPLMRRSMQKRNDRFVQNLKDLLEG